MSGPEPTVSIGDAEDQAGENGKEVLIEHDGIRVSLKLGEDPHVDEAGTKLAILDLVDEQQSRLISSGSDNAIFHIYDEDEEA